MRDARMIFVEGSGAEARSATVDTYPLLTWLGHIPVKEDVRIGWRTAEVGAIVLSEVIVVSHHEAKLATAAARAEAARTTEHKDADVLRFCDIVDALITTTKPVEYFSAWVIIETADID